MRPDRAKTVLLVLALAGCASARTLLAEAVAPTDSACANTTAGLRVVTKQDSVSVYPNPCKSTPLTSVKSCEVFNYLGAKAVSSCGDGYCYRLIMTSGGVEGWLIDHTVGKSDSNVTSVDASGCGQYIDPSCVNTQDGVRLLVGIDTQLYPAPCPSGQTAGTVAHCSSFVYTGTKQTSTCGDGSCMRQVKLPSGSEGWIVDHIFGSRISSVGDIDSAVCKAPSPTSPAPTAAPAGSPPPQVPLAEIAARRQATLVEVQDALKDDASTDAYFQGWIRRQPVVAYPVDSPEYAKRRQIFAQNLEGVRRANTLATTWYAGVNGFSDLTPEEFQERYTGSVAPRRTPETPAAPEEAARRRRALLEGPAPPVYKDWEAEGKVTPVGDQQDCGACWAFAVLGAVESKYLISTGQNLELSVQELVDCLNRQCPGGDPINGFRYVRDYGVLKDQAYPWTGTFTGFCNTSRLTSPAPPERSYLRDDEGFFEVQPLSATELMKAVAQQPVVVMVDAQEDMKQYSSGIFQPTLCRNTSDVSALNHAVLVVGYDATAGPGVPGTYWKIKNSWGTNWGQNGYMLMPMQPDGQNGTCGMYAWAAGPTEVGKSPLGNGNEGAATFIWPRYLGLNVDYCLNWSGDCGEAAATKFCKLQGFSYAKAFSNPVGVGTNVFAATVQPETGAICSAYYHGCETFEWIICDTIA